MKRIALFWAEAMAAGVPAALHVNGRTPRDFQRWADFIRGRPEVEVISFEFGTGGMYVDRGKWFVQQLCGLANYVGGPLDIVCRGARFLNELERSFARVSLIDTTTFMRTVNRERAETTGDGPWRKSMTLLDQPIDRMLQENSDRRSQALAARSGQA